VVDDGTRVLGWIMEKTYDSDQLVSYARRVLAKDVEIVVLPRVVLHVSTSTYADLKV
jgi:hypothetical protein